MWFRKAEEPPQLEDLASVLAEGPELLPGNAPSSPGRHGLSAGGAGASAQQALAASSEPPAAAAVVEDTAPLPLSSGSPLLALSSPEKAFGQQDAVLNSATTGSWLPSVAAWLPFMAVPNSVAGSQRQQQQEQQQPCEQQSAAQPSWRDSLPSASLLWLPSLLSGSSSGSDGGSAAAAVLPPDGSARAAAAGGAALAGGSRQDGSSLLAWAATAPHELASACHQAAHRLGSVGSTAVGASLMGATVGGICAGPLGAAAGAKSGAAWVAAGALSGAAVQRLRDGGHPDEAAAEDTPHERELQAISGAGAGGAASSGRSAPLGGHAGGSSGSQ